MINPKSFKLSPHPPGEDVLHLWHIRRQDEIVSDQQLRPHSLSISGYDSPLLTIINCSEQHWRWWAVMHHHCPEQHICRLCSLNIWTINLTQICAQSLVDPLHSWISHQHDQLCWQINWLIMVNWLKVDDGYWLIMADGWWCLLVDHDGQGWFIIKSTLIWLERGAKPLIRQCEPIHQARFQAQKNDPLVIPSINWNQPIWTNINHHWCVSTAVDGNNNDHDCTRSGTSTIEQ